MTHISFDVDRRSARIIHEISRRAVKLLIIALESGPFTGQDVTMDVTAVHCNGCPLRLQALLDADDFNFAHGILGIRRHLNRKTGKLTGHFSPRFAQPEADPTILSEG